MYSKCIKLVVLISLWCVAGLREGFCTVVFLIVPYKGKIHLTTYFALKLEVAGIAISFTLTEVVVLSPEGEVNTSPTVRKTLNIQGYSKLREPIKTRENCYPLIW